MYNLNLYDIEEKLLGAVENSLNIPRINETITIIFYGLTHDFTIKFKILSIDNHYDTRLVKDEKNTITKINLIVEKLSHIPE